MSASQSNRRMFLKTAGGASIAVAVFGVGGAGTANAGELRVARVADWTRYRVESDPAVRVNFSTGRRFAVTVTDADGSVLEAHRNLSVDRLFRIESRFFSVSAAPDDAAA